MKILILNVINMHKQNHKKKKLLLEHFSRLYMRNMRQKA